jgi:hypothetical protein
MRFIYERRVRRSSDRSTALRYQLERSRNEAGLEAIVLADRDGLPVGGAGDEAVCREMAAYAPLVSKSMMGLPLPPLLSGGDLEVRPVTLHGRAYFLAALGGGTARDVWLRSSVEGVGRILATN